MGKAVDKARCYYDGHYIDSGLTLEERKRRTAESKRKSDALKSWDEAGEELYATQNRQTAPK